MFLICKIADEEQTCEQMNETSTEHHDFESALKEEIFDIKNKKQALLAIRNDVKGVVFFKASSNLDINSSFQRLIHMIKERAWKPK